MLHLVSLELSIESVLMFNLMRTKFLGQMLLRLKKGHIEGSRMKTTVGKYTKVYIF